MSSGIWMQLFSFILYICIRTYVNILSCSQMKVTGSDATRHSVHAVCRLAQCARSVGPTWEALQWTCFRLIFFFDFQSNRVEEGRNEQTQTIPKRTLTDLTQFEPHAFLSQSQEQSLVELRRSRTSLCNSLHMENSLTLFEFIQFGFSVSHGRGGSPWALH